MSEQNDAERENQTEDESSEESDSSDLSERISDAIAPALSSVSVRVAEAVASSFGKGSSAEDVDQPDEASEDSEESEDTDSEEDDDSAEADDSSDRTIIGRAADSLRSSFLSSLKEESGEQLESIMDSVVEGLFSRRARGVARALADDTLQATLYDSLKSIDDPEQRYRLYRDMLRRLRPIARDAVDAMFNWRSRETLKRQLHGAIPSIVNGDFETAFRMIIDALSDVTNYAEEVVWQNSGEVLKVFQEMSTELLEEKVQDEAEERINPEEIRQHMQKKADEAREKLQTTVGALQEGMRSAQQQIGARTGGSGNSGGQGMPPSGRPPNGAPPTGKPPSGRPPSGQPPSGRPPSGAPPNGVHPSVARLQQEQSPRRSNPSRRKLPER